MLDQNSRFLLYVKIAYAKYANIRLKLGDDLFNVAHRLAHPWLVGREFNMILNGEEKIGGIPIQ